MTDEPLLPFGDAEQVRRARDEGMRRAADHSGRDWCDRAELMIYEYLIGSETFFVDDFWEWALNHGLEWPASPRAMGPVILRVAKSGAMVKTERYRTSVRSNLSVKPVWRSMRFQGVNGANV